MINCTSKPISFSPLNHKKVEANFTGSNIGSDGGILLLRELDKKLQLTKRLSQIIKDNRHPAYVDHTIEQSPLSRLLQRLLLFAFACVLR